MMAGKPDMTLHGWRQLIEWSIEHSCTERDEKSKLMEEWQEMWDQFCNSIIDNFEGKLKGYLEPEGDKDVAMRDVP